MEQNAATAGGVLDFAEHFAGPLQQAVASGPLKAFRAQLGDAFWGGAVDEVVRAVAASFAVPLPEVLAAAWQSHAAFAPYADPVRHPPGHTELVELTSHSVHWEHEPQVEITWNGATLGVLPFRVMVEVTIPGGAVAVRDARFRELRTGRLEVRGAVTLGNAEVAAREGAVEVPGALRFGDEGIPIRAIPLGEIPIVGGEAQARGS